MATDLMTWNITRDVVLERMAVSPDSDWEVDGPGGELQPDRSRKPGTPSTSSTGASTSTTPTAPGCSSSWTRTGSPLPI
ncbi:MAG: hypothetical protein ACE5FL_14595 [Myxococcota bacterium]